MMIDRREIVLFSCTEADRYIQKSYSEVKVMHHTLI